MQPTQFRPLDGTSPYLRTPTKKSRLLYDWRSVNQYVLVSGPSLGPMIRFDFFLSFAGKFLWYSSWGAFSDERTVLCFVVQSVSGQSSEGLTTTHYCLIRNYWVAFPSPLTTRRDYGGSVLTRLHTGRHTSSQSQNQSYFAIDSLSVSTSWCRAHSRTCDQMLISFGRLMSEFCCPVICWAPSLTRGRVCHLSV
jgi:hypothetical protein